MKIVTKKYKKDRKRSLRKSKKLKKEMNNGSKSKSKITQKNKSDGGSRALTFFGTTSSNPLRRGIHNWRHGKLVRTNGDILEAVLAWYENSKQAENEYGHISLWNTSQVTNMGALFRRNTTFNENINTKEVTKEDSPTGKAYRAWDVSNVTDMRYMFFGAAAFNQDISNWNVSNVTNMWGMFHNAAAFNQDIGEWNVSNVTNMNGMSENAAAFNQDIGGWNVFQVTTMAGMFFGAAAFNQDIEMECVPGHKYAWYVQWCRCLQRGYKYKRSNKRRQSNRRSIQSMGCVAGHRYGSYVQGLLPSTNL